MVMLLAWPPKQAFQVPLLITFSAIPSIAHQTSTCWWQFPSKFLGMGSP